MEGQALTGAKTNERHWCSNLASTDSLVSPVGQRRDLAPDRLPVATQPVAALGRRAPATEGAAQIDAKK
jgi:hypothetical protein